MKIKNFSFKPFMILLITLTLGIFACKQDIIMPETQQYNGTKPVLSPKDKAAIADAKNWFDKNYERLTSPSTPIKPVWDEAFVLNNTIEVPFIINGKKNQISSGTGNGKTNLVLAKKSTNDYKAFCMGYLPSKNFTGTVEGINIANYKQQKFDGFVTVSPLDFRTMGAYTFKNGKSVKFNKLTKKDENTAQSRCVVVGYVKSCHEYCTQGDDAVIECIFHCDEFYIYDCSGNDDGGGGGCPNANDPLCDDDGGGTIECPAMPWCDDPGSGNNNNNNTGCRGDCDGDGDDDELYTCASNFAFSSANPSGSIKQEAGISGLSYKLSNSVTLTIGTYYFSAPFHDVNGNLIYTRDQAATNAANATNYAEGQVRAEFARNRNVSIAELQQLWNDKVSRYFVTDGNPSTIIGYSDFTTSSNQINFGHTPEVKPYKPCD
jgi:hypothetical protein